MNKYLTEDLQLKQTLTMLFGEMSESQLEFFLSLAELKSFEAGEYVFHQDEKGNTFYIVVTGRFRALQYSAESIFILGDISAGEPIGELSLFRNEARSASVVALRKSTLLSLKYEDYLILIKEFPLLSISMSQFVIDRLKRNGNQKMMGTSPKNIAVVNLQPDQDVSPYTDDMQTQFLSMGLEIRIYDHSSYSGENGQAIFDDMEKQSGLNFLVCRIGELEWTKQCIAYCDLVIVATGFTSDYGLYEIEKVLNLYTLHELNNASLPSNTRRWLNERNVDLHIHVRKNNLLDIRRFCRIVTHQAIGLVLGGGGVKGFGHVGAAMALVENGVEFDFVGGTSIGAVFSVAFTQTDFDFNQIKLLCKSAADNKLTSNDFTFPLLSLMSGNKVRRFLKEIYKDTYLEDLWINTYCVSTNFSNATLKVHKTGLARQMVEASMAIPGFFPPVILDQHLHIDGAVIDNLPVDAMYQKPVRHVIAISVSSENINNIDLVKIPSSWQQLWSRMTRSSTVKLPGFASILINSITINSRNKEDASKPKVSLFLDLDLKKYKFLDWGSWDAIVQSGYDQTSQNLIQTKKEYQFWKG